MKKDERAITKNEVNRSERRDLENEAADALDAMDKTERDKLDNAIEDARDNYLNSVDDAIRSAGYWLAATMAELRQRFGTLIVDAALQAEPNLEDLSLYECPKSIAEVEEDHPSAKLTK